MVQPAASDDPTPPQPTPDAFVGFTIVRVAHVLQRRMEAALQTELGISVRQFGALSYLAQDPGIGSGALARQLLITAQSAGPLVDDMVRRGLVARAPAPAGVRRAVHLTAEGERLLRRGYRIADRLRQEDEAALAPEDSRAINAALLRLLAGLTAP